MWIVLILYAVVAVALVAAAYLLTPKPKNGPDPTKPEINVPIAEIGVKIPVLFGTRDIDSPLVVWYGDVEIRDVKGDPSGKKK